MNNMKVNLIEHINIQQSPQPAAAPSPASLNGLICPLTSKPLTDPVIAPNGVTYNADAIYPYIQEHGHLPTDDRPVTPRKIWPDQNMRDRLSAHPTDKDEHLEDPITFETMTHPVVASDGRTYNQSTLETLFRQNNGISPFSRAQLATKGYRNQTLMTELNPQMGQTANAALATEPTRNLVTFEPQAEIDVGGPLPHTTTTFKKCALVMLAVTAVALVFGLTAPLVFPAFVFVAVIAQICLTVASMGGTVLLASLILKCFDRFF